MNCCRPVPYLVEFRTLKFLVSGRPEKYKISSFAQKDVKKLVRVSEDAYDVSVLNAKGIAVEDFLFPDGTFPEIRSIEKWTHIVFQYFIENPGRVLAVHDRSGLGRAPLLVMIALTEAGMKAVDAFDLIRRKRKGCLNVHQFEGLMKYKPKCRLKKLYTDLEVTHSTSVFPTVLGPINP
ncbi:protein tyrosine phosphatase type IVA 3-like isoform X2 [Agrilus planipennis]|uniref:Protein tyrosine phosphatase type IVA 3 n=1 Tax=Agrilus planipennis TaxID=224129 RepID=A0A1W4WNX1_AGRPL|nr:protein tyrosine phosphatase type IVA 3-like isoform X2 [Agrilus planipennis]